MYHFTVCALVPRRLKKRVANATLCKALITLYLSLQA
ncbi:Uncharacterised protein [Vibrio cholerae]|nr:Uncharacterised protein [Vibrio cholerae]